MLQAKKVPVHSCDFFFLYTFASESIQVIPFKLYRKISQITTNTVFIVETRALALNFTYKICLDMAEYNREKPYKWYRIIVYTRSLELCPIILKVFNTQHGSDF